MKKTTRTARIDLARCRAALRLSTPAPADQEALPEACRRPYNREGPISRAETSMEGQTTIPGVTAADLAELEALERAIDALLPPLYRGRYETVEPVSMGS